MAGAAKEKPTTFIALLALAALVSGCGRCSSPFGADRGSGGPASGSASPREIPLPAPLPPPKPIAFSKLRGMTSVALPSGCSLRAPIAEAPLPSSTRFVAEPRSTGALVIADSEGDPPKLVGVAALTLDPQDASRDPKPLPWTEASSLPRLARSADSSWIAAIERPTAGSSARVDLWRGGELSAIGEGDRFEAADLTCGDHRCALLTSRLGSAAAAGADVWIGDPHAPFASWKRVEVSPAAGESDARPIAIASIEPGIVVALADRGACVFQLVDDPAGARELARLPAPHGVLDVIAAPDPIALTQATAVDENGCAVLDPASDHGTPSSGGDDAEEAHDDPSAGRADPPSDQPDPRDPKPSVDKPLGAPPPAVVMGTGTAGVRLERSGSPAIEIRTAAPPTQGALRKLVRGSIALWIAPLGCQQARRVVFAVVLDDKGAPVGDVLPISDANRFAAASSGDSVDLWMERGGTLTWVPMKCGPKAP